LHNISFLLKPGNPDAVTDAFRLATFPFQQQKSKAAASGATASNSVLII
jgi:hypothetical protein